MKVSIWQQFSSNHSANFTTVGHFESAEWAEMVATEVKEMLYLIAWWHEQVEKYGDSRELVRAVTTNPKSIVGLPDFFQKPQVLQMLYAGDFEPLTPPEAYYCQKYQLDRWRIDRNTSLDWVSSQYALKYVTTWKNLVIIEPDASTWAGSHPFHTILEKLGGNVASSLEGELYIALHLCWKMPTIQAANDLVAYMLQPKLPAYQGIKIDGMGYGYIYNDADLVANQNEVVLKNFRLSYYNVVTHSSISFVDALQKIMTFLEEQGATDIIYKFSSMSP